MAPFFLKNISQYNILLLAGTFRAEPLPSAGVLSIMQAFCDGGEVGVDGFASYPNAE